MRVSLLIFSINNRTLVKQQDLLCSHKNNYYNTHSKDTCHCNYSVWKLECSVTEASLRRQKVARIYLGLSSAGGVNKLLRMCVYIERQRQRLCFILHADRQGRQIRAEASSETYQTLSCLASPVSAIPPEGKKTWKLKFTSHFLILNLNIIFLSTAFSRAKYREV